MIQFPSSATKRPSGAQMRDAVAQKHALPRTIYARVQDFCCVCGPLAGRPLRGLLMSSTDCEGIQAACDRREAFALPRPVARQRPRNSANWALGMPRS